MDKLIELREVTAGYGNKIALRNVTLDVWKNDFLGIIGPNGGGKTTLLNIIGGLDTRSIASYFRNDSFLR